MKVLVVGATGVVGGDVARHPRTQGHHVTGLARSDEAAESLAAQGISALRGDLGAGRAAVVAAARQTDAVVFAAQLDPDAERITVADLSGDPRDGRPPGADLGAW